MNDHRPQNRFNIFTLMITAENLNNKCVCKGINPEERIISFEELRLYYAATENMLKNQAEYEIFINLFERDTQTKEGNADVRHS